MEKTSQSIKFLPAAPSIVWNIWYNFCKTELTQNEKLSMNIVRKILFSKRLLIDHVESLEGCLPPTTDSIPTTEIFTLTNTSIIVATTLIQKLITPTSLKFTLIPFSIVASGFCCLYLAKKVSDVRLDYMEKEINRLIDSIDQFGNCIKRNITYFNEILAMKANELIESRQIERAWDCITAIKEVVDILYESTRILEKHYKLPAKFSEFYNPMEELRDSDYFTRNVTDYNPKNIKDFYNIFAYVQSQFLLRLALTVSQDSSIKFLHQNMTQIESLIRQHVNEEELHFANLSIELKRKQQIEIANFRYQQTHQIQTGPVAVLKDSSLKLSACIIAVAEECQKLDVILHKINISDNNSQESIKSQNNDDNHLFEVVKSMTAIENSLIICYDDFKRLNLVFHRYLGNKLNNIGKCTNIYDNLIDNHKHYQDTDSRIIVDDEIEDEKFDDFYAYIHDEKLENIQEYSNDSCTVYDMTNIDKKITKNKFKPVLRQLKSKIDSIRVEMLAKERQILELKGFDVDNLFENDKSIQKSIRTNEPAVDGVRVDNANGSSSDSEGSADEVEAEAKNRKIDNFTEMRNFLAQKQAVNIFGGLELPNNQNVITEEILE